LSVALVILHVMHMRRSVICYLPAHYLIKGTIFEKKVNMKCVFWFPLQPLSETSFILRRKKQDVIRNVGWSSNEVPFIFVIF
jgi:hypothetical protein